MASAFKDIIADDLDNVFFNPDEFVEMHKIAGVRGMAASAVYECPVVVDRDLYQERMAKDAVENITLDGLVFFIKKSEWLRCFDALPKAESALMFDGARYTVESVNDDFGLLEITLSANRG